MTCNTPPRKPVKNFISRKLVLPAMQVKDWQVAVEYWA
jgi:hypothetical protein